MRCDSCEMLSINVVPCHEHGCPNSRKTWVAKRGEWVRFVACFVCVFDVEAGTVCGCDSPEDVEIEELESEEN
jgi:hypothetical protein